MFAIFISMKIELDTIQNDLLKTGMKLASAISHTRTPSGDKMYQAYLVGGCVRDIVRWKLGQIEFPEIHDIDIATNMPIAELQKNFKTASNNGEAHGTILVFMDGIPFEVTQFRTDGKYTDGRRPDKVEFTDDFMKDCARRDFTINAMGLTGNGIVFDYFGGIKDIERKWIRAVGDPVQRFSEDTLRIMRGIRFMINFDYSISEKTFDAMKTVVDKYKWKLDYMLSYPRIRDEISKVKTNFAGYFGILEKTGLLNWLIAFRDMDKKNLILRIQRVPHVDSNNIFAIIAFGEDKYTLHRLAGTREDSRLLKWYNYMAKKLDETQENMSWDSVVKFVEGDYKAVLAMTQKVPAWHNRIKPALQLAKDKPDMKAITKAIQDAGTKPGPLFGIAVDALVEADYVEKANKLKF
jgi:tRNA nucleotidyltransferase/poly(A) polymerase